MVLTWPQHGHTFFEDGSDVTPTLPYQGFTKGQEGRRRGEKEQVGKGGEGGEGKRREPKAAEKQGDKGESREGKRREGAGGRAKSL